MSTTLDFALKKGAAELHDKYRFNVLVELMLCANVRNRCWPTIAYIVEGIGKDKEVVSAAVHWLEEHGAIEIVPFDKRIGEECNLPPRQHVYQLTGFVLLDGKEVPYLYTGSKERDFHLLKGGISEVRENRPKVYPEENTDSSDIKEEDIPVPPVGGKRQKLPAGLLAPEKEKPQPGQERAVVFHIKHLIRQTGRSRVLPKAAAEKLLHPIEGQPSPADLFDTVPLFHHYISACYEYWKDLTVKPDSAHLVNLICNFSGPYGWLKYKMQQVKSVRRRTIVELLTDLFAVNVYYTDGSMETFKPGVTKEEAKANYENGVKA